MFGITAFAEAPFTSLGGVSVQVSVSGLAATDQGVDTCTNNFATLNPLYNFYVDPTLAEGNTKVSHNADCA